MRTEKADPGSHEIQMGGAMECQDRQTGGHKIGTMGCSQHVMFCFVLKQHVDSGCGMYDKTS